MLPKRRRIQLIYERLKAAVTPTSIDEALALINQVVKDVEDDFSGKPYQANPGLKYDGRMYGPREDRVIAINGGMMASTKGNYIYLFNDGSFVVCDELGKVFVANIAKDEL